MRVRIPFSYVTDVITSGGNEATRHYSETFEFDVPEVTSVEAPVVLRWRGERPIKLGYGANEPSVPADIRRHGAFLHEPRRERRWRHGQDDAVEPLRAEDLAACLEGRTLEQHRTPRPLGDFFASSAIVRSPEAKWKGPPKAGTVNTRWSSKAEAREKALAEARAEAEGLLVVDGLVHFRVREPVLVANREGAVWIQSEIEQKLSPGIFRLDALEEAAGRAALASGKAPSQVARPDFELLDPACLRLDTDEVARWALMQVAYELERDVGREVPRLPLPVIEAIYDLKDEYRRHYQKIVPERLHPVCLALCEAVRSHAPDEAGLVRLALHDLRRLAPALGVDMDREDEMALEGMSL